MLIFSVYKIHYSDAICCNTHLLYNLYTAMVVDAMDSCVTIVSRVVGTHFSKEKCTTD